MFFYAHLQLQMNLEAKKIEAEVGDIFTSFLLPPAFIRMSNHYESFSAADQR